MESAHGSQEIETRGARLLFVSRNASCSWNVAAPSSRSYWRSMIRSPVTGSGDTASGNRLCRLEATTVVDE